MANPKHIAWLLEGVESWNRRREKEYFYPDFEQTNLREEFDRVGKLGPNGSVQLDRVNLLFANLVRADFNAANLRDADISFAKLTQANLSYTDLTGANLSHSCLTDTNLEGAILTDADLYSTEPWNAYLYSSSNISLDQIQDMSTPIKSIEDSLAKIRSLKTLHPDSSMYFRGESGSGWELRPSVTRDEFTKSERDMLVDLISRRPEEFNGMTSALAQWVLAQHHGLRTRFLDITKNPLVGLFHAAKKDKRSRTGVYTFFPCLKSWSNHSTATPSALSLMSRGYRRRIRKHSWVKLATHSS